MVESFTLYHTSGCHLCEKAKDLLWPLLTDSIKIIECDIAEYDKLIEVYGTRIPVLCSMDGGELAWPFDTATLASFLQDRKVPSE